MFHCLQHVTPACVDLVGFKVLHPVSCCGFLPRLAQHLASKWLSKLVTLHEVSEGGQLKTVIPESDTTLGHEDLEALKQIPGVYEAYQGLQKLQLEVLATWCKIMA